MSKRLIRIKSGNIFSRRENLHGIELNAVLNDGNTHFGTLLDLTSEILTLADSKQHQHQIPIKDLYEVIYDYESN